MSKKFSYRCENHVCGKDCVVKSVSTVIPSRCPYSRYVDIKFKPTTTKSHPKKEDEIRPVVTKDTIEFDYKGKTYVRGTGNGNCSSCALKNKETPYGVKTKGKCADLGMGYSVCGDLNWVNVEYV